MVRTWGFRRVQHRPLAFILLRVVRLQQRSGTHPCLSRKEHIPTGRAVAPLLNRSSRQIPKMTSETISRFSRITRLMLFMSQTLGLVHCY